MLTRWLRSDTPTAITVTACLVLGWKQHWATCCGLCSSTHKGKDSEEGFPPQDRHGRADVLAWEVLGSSWPRSALKVLPFGSCSEQTPGGDHFFPVAPGEAPVDHSLWECSPGTLAPATRTLQLKNCIQGALPETWSSIRIVHGVLFLLKCALCQST